MKEITAIKVLDDYRVWLHASTMARKAKKWIFLPNRARAFLLFGTAMKISAKRTSVILANCFGTTRLISVPIRSGCK